MLYYKELNIRFLEEFNALEQLCNQIYGDKHGVTSYINDMESLALNARQTIYNWDYCFKQLKHVRYKRNKLSHGEVPYDENFANNEDINFLIDFKNKILNRDDPISAYNQSRLKKQPYTYIQPNEYYKPSYNYKSNNSSSDYFLTFVLILILIVIVPLLFFMLLNR